ncbi:MAG: hypothetical protein ACRDFB_03315 [Rhabdochlamydiaceae bacterium]
MQKGFNGELAPEFWGRMDVPKYPYFLKKMENFKVTSSSTAQKCSGTEYIINTPNNEPVRLIKFILNAQNGYLVELSNNLIRFFQDGAIIETESSTWNNSTTYNPGQAVTDGGNTYIAIQSNINIEPGVTTGWSAYWFENNQPTYSIPSDYLTSELPDLDYRQVGNTIFIVHPSHKPTKLIFNPDVLGDGSEIGAFYLTDLLTVPKIISTISLINATAGDDTGSNPYSYKVTIEDLTTGEESFPMPVNENITPKNEIQQISFTGSSGSSSGGAMQLSFQGQIATIQYDDSLASMQSKFEALSTIGSGNISVTGIGSATVFEDIIVEAGTMKIQFEFIGSLAALHLELIEIVNYGTGPGQSAIFNSVGEVFAESLFDIAETQVGQGPLKYNTTITSLTANGTDSLSVGMEDTTYYESGDQVIIYNTGCTYLDNRVFNITVISMTEVKIYLDASFYNLPATIPNAARIGPTAVTIVGNPPTLSKPNVISWELNPDSLSGFFPQNVTYNIYGGQGGVFGFIGTTQADSFPDPGIPPDISFDPPIYNPIYMSENDFPSAIESYQQRLIIGATNKNPLEFSASRIGFLENFTTRTNLQADDAVIRQTLEADAGSTIQNFLNYGFLIVFTDQGEITVKGDATGTLTPTNTNTATQTFNGAAKIKPLKINKSIIYLQSQTSIVRDCQALITPYGFTYLASSNEISMMAKHLVNGFSITDWDYQRIYDGIIYAVRNDGIVLGITYDSEIQRNAWWQRTTTGKFENVCVVSSPLEDVVYLAVNRTASDGTTIRTLERKSEDMWTDIKDSNFLDYSSKYDGRNTDDTKTMTLSASDWTGQLTLTASFDAFSPFVQEAPAHHQIYLYDSDGFLVRCTVVGYTSATVIAVTPDRDIPDGSTSFSTDGTVHPNMRNVAISNWAIASDYVLVSDDFYSADLELASVQDAYVTSNPFKETHVSRSTLTIGIDTYKIYQLPIFGSVNRVGLPFKSDIQTLDFDIQEPDSLVDKKTIVKRVSCLVKDTQGFWAGVQNPDTNREAPQNQAGPTQTPDYTFGLIEAKVRKNSGYDSPVDIITGRMLVDIAGKFDYGSNVFIRSIDPIPCEITALGSSIDIQSMGR